MNIINYLSYKLPHILLNICIALFTCIDHRWAPKFVWIQFERLILRLGAFLAFSRIKAFSVKPYTDAYTIHTLLQHNEVYRYVICIQSFLRYVESYPRIVIHDDGTLTLRDMKLLRRIPRCSVIPNAWIEQHFYMEYRNNPVLAKYRDFVATTRKIIDLAFLKDDSQKTLILDSDVGFFKNPETVLDYLYGKQSNTKIKFMSDIQDAYLCDSKELNKMFNIRITPRVNSGLVCFDTTLLTKQFVAKFFDKVGVHLYNSKYSYVWTEQTPWALLASIYNSKRLSSLYHVGLQETPQEVICRHYVHTSKYYFIQDLLRFL